MTHPIVTPIDAVQAYLISPEDTVKLAVLSGPSMGSPSTLVFEVWEPGGAQPPNSHPDSPETFFVVRGQATAYSDDRQVELKAGDTLVLPAGSTHRIVNNSDRERFYTITLMASDGGFERMITDGTPVSLDPEDLAVLGLVTLSA